MNERMVQSFFDELEKIAVTSELKPTAAFSASLLRKSNRVGVVDAKKPPDPSLRSVATKV